MIDYIETTGTFRGSVDEITALRRLLSGDDQLGDGPVASAAVRALTENGEDPALTAMRQSLAQTLFTIDLTVAGPGGRHEHTMSAGLNAVGVRISDVREGLREISGFPVISLPGGMTRLVRFLPGRDITPHAHDISVASEDLLGLTHPETEHRTSAWDRIAKQLPAADTHLPSDVDDDSGVPPESWQVVLAESSWTSPDGESARDLAVHLRWADAYFLVVEDGEDAKLRPATSIRAWESMIHVLPDHRDVARPA